MSEESDRLIGELHGKVDLIVSGIAEDREDRRIFREEMRVEIGDLRKEVAPVVSDHKTVMKIFKWAGAGGVMAFFGWVWAHLKDTIKP